MNPQDQTFLTVYLEEWARLGSHAAFQHAISPAHRKALDDTANEARQRMLYLLRTH